MRAIVVERVGGPEVLELKQVADPVAGPNDILVRVTRTGVNFADTLRSRGRYGGPVPFTPGLDAVGTIAALGAEVKGFAVGQRVACFPETGAYAELVLARPVLTFALPEQVPDDTAAGLNVLMTAYNIVHLCGRVQPGESVLIHAGAGAVGSTALQIARLAGGKPLLATVGSPDKFGFARKAGADVVINYREDDFAAAATKALDGKGVDVILDSVAGEVAKKSIDILAPFGRYVVYGRASGQNTELGLDTINGKNQSIVSYTSGGYRRARPALLRPAVEAVLGLIAASRLTLDIGARFPLEQAADAHRLVESRSSHGKVLIDVA